MGQLWLAGILPGLLMACLFVLYIWIRCRVNPKLGPIADDLEQVSRSEKIRLLGAGIPATGDFCMR